MSNLFDRVKLFVQRNKEFRSALYDIMGFYPHDIDLYRIAFAHKSQEYKSKRTGDRPLNNERLEFLGDAVLETVVSDIVYHHFKNKREGFLTNTRSKIVSRESLGKLAKDLGIDRLIQSHTSGKAHNSFLAGNAFEALMGAIYLDRGFDYAFRFIEHRIMGSVLDLEGVAHKEVNFKSKLLEWSQKNRILIDFRDKQTSGSSSNTPVFVSNIVLEGLFAGDGKGFSKKEAQQNAAKEALTRMRREPKFIDEIFLSKEKRTAMEADPCFVLPVIEEIEEDLTREAERKLQKAEQKAERKKREPQKEQPSREQPKKVQPQKEQLPKEQSSKAQQTKKQSKEEETPKQQSKTDKPEQPKVEKNKTERSKEATPKQSKEATPSQSKEAAHKAEQPKEEILPTGKASQDPAAVVIPIVLKDISANATDAPVSEAPVAEASSVEASSVETSIVETPVVEASGVETPASDDTSQEAPAAEPATAPSATRAKRSRHRGKRQNAAGYTNTESVPAETSHRAEKAAKRIEEAKKEKVRKKARKTAKAATKGMDLDAPQSAEQSASAPTQSPAQSTETAVPAQPKKKPRRRKKAHAELPSETPNPEHESAVQAAEDAAYNQSHQEE